MKRISFTLLFTLLFMQVVAAHDEASTLLANASENATELATPDKDDKGTGVDQENKKTPIFTKPKFNGFAIASYQATFQESGNSNSFNVRIVRASIEGNILGELYYKIQGQINGNTTNLGSSPRLVDYFMEWQRFSFFKVKLGSSRDRSPSRIP